MAIAIIPQNSNPCGDRKNWLSMSQADKLICKGFVLPVKPIGYKSLVKQIERDGGSEYKFGVHIEDLGDGRVEMHIPTKELIEFSARLNTTDVRDYARFINEYTSVDFSYVPSEWYEIMLKGEIEIYAPQWAAIVSFADLVPLE